MCTRFSMPDPRLMTDYTPRCIREETLKLKLDAGTDQEYRKQLQTRAIDIINDQTHELQQRTKRFRSSFNSERVIDLPDQPLSQNSSPCRKTG